MKDSTIPGKRKLLLNALVFLFWLLVWQAVYRLVDRDIYLPSPLSVLTRLAELVQAAAFWKDVLLSVSRIVAGFLLSVAAATLLGVAAGLNPYVHMLFNPLVAAVKATPVISFIMIALFWFTSGNVPVFICFLMCFPIVWTHMVEGIRNIDRKLLEMAKLYRVKLSVTVRKVYIPALVPFFSPACLTALGLGWKVGVAAEVLSHPKSSIGSHLYEAKAYLDSAELFAWTLVVVLLSMAFEKTFAWSIRRLGTGGKKTVTLIDA